MWAAVARWTHPGVHQTSQKLKVVKPGQVPELWERAEELIEEAVAHGDHLPHTPNVDITPNVATAHNLNRSGSPLADGKPQIPNPKPYKP